MRSIKLDAFVKDCESCMIGESGLASEILVCTYVCMYAVRRGLYVMYTRYSVR